MKKLAATVVTLALAVAFGASAHRFTLDKAAIIGGTELKIETKLVSQGPGVHVTGHGTVADPFLVEFINGFGKQDVPTLGVDDTGVLGGIFRAGGSFSLAYASRSRGALRGLELRLRHRQRTNG